VWDIKFLEIEMEDIQIPLTQGKVALIDEEDYGFISYFKWYARKGYKGRWYAATNVCKEGKRTTLLMKTLVSNLRIVDSCDAC